MDQERAQAKLLSLYKVISRQGYLGANSVHRRALTAVAAEIEGNSEVPAQARLDFKGAYNEICADDRRRSVFIQPEDALAASFIDLYSGRLDALEVRTLDAGLLASAQKVAREHIKETHPLVVVSRVGGWSEQQIIDSLRSMALMLELNLRNGKPLVDESATLEARGIAARSYEKLSNRTQFDPTCWYDHTEGGATQWDQVDLYFYLYQNIRYIYNCDGVDKICGNATYDRDIGPWFLKEIWEDTGPDQPPPQLPPDFQPVPWDNRLPVVASTSATMVTSHYGWRNLLGKLDFHPGIDIGAPPGSAVFSLDTGSVVHINRASPNGETGIIINTGAGSNLIYQYWHMIPDDKIKIGQGIPVGFQLGTVSPYHPHPHLHLAKYAPPGGDWLHKNNQNSINPCP